MSNAAQTGAEENMFGTVVTEIRTIELFVSLVKKIPVAGGTLALAALWNDVYEIKQRY